MLPLVVISLWTAGCTLGQEKLGDSADWSALEGNWSTGGNFTFRGQVYQAAPEDAWWTDGTNYLYGRPVGSAAAQEACAREQPPVTNGTYVFLAQDMAGNCHWARYPSVACVGTGFCVDLNRPAGPTRPPIS